MESLFFDQNGKPILYELANEFDAAYKVTRGDRGGYQVWQSCNANWVRDYVPVNIYGGFVNFRKPIGGPVRGECTQTFSKLFEKMAFTFDFLVFHNQNRERLEYWLKKCREYHPESCWIQGENIFSLLDLK